MHYHVQAKLKPGTAKDFLAVLTDGTVEGQRPDGPEIVASMNRAKVDAEGWVRWEETCYCATPLHHERTTVYDRFFNDMEAVENDAALTVDGRPFMELLKEA